MVVDDLFGIVRAAVTDLDGVAVEEPTKNPPPIDELKDFEDDMLNMIQSTKFNQVNNPFLFTTRHVTADKKTLAHSTETACNHQ